MSCTSTDTQLTQATFFLQELADSNQALDNQLDNYNNLSNLVGQNAVVTTSKQLAINLNFSSTNNKSDVVSAAAATFISLQQLLYSDFQDSNGANIRGLLPVIYGNLSANGGAFAKLLNPQNNANPALPFSTAYTGPTYDVEDGAAAFFGVNSLDPTNYTGATVQYTKKTFQQQLIALMVQTNLGNCWYPELANVSFKSQNIDVKVVLMDSTTQAAVDPQPTQDQWLGTAAAAYMPAENTYVAMYLAGSTNAASATSSVPTKIYKLFSNSNDLLSAVGQANITLSPGDIPTGLTLQQTSLLLYGATGPDLDDPTVFAALYSADCSDKNDVSAWATLVPTNNTTSGAGEAGNKLAVGAQIQAAYNGYQDYTPSLYPDIVTNLNETVSDTNIYDQYVSGLDSAIRMQKWIGLTNTAATNDDLVQFANVNYTGGSGTNVKDGTRAYIQSNDYLKSGLTTVEAIVNMLTNNGLDQISTNTPSISWTNSPTYDASVFCNGGLVDGSQPVANWVNGTPDLVTIYEGIRQAALTQAVGSTTSTASQSQVESYLFSSNTANTFASVVTTATVTDIQNDTGLIATKSIEYKTEVAMIQLISSYQLASVLLTTKISEMGNNSAIFQQMLVDNSNGSAQANNTTTYSTDLYPIFSDPNLVSVFLFSSNAKGILNVNYVSSTYNLFKGLSSITTNQKIVLFAFDAPATPVQLICMGQTSTTDTNAAQDVINRLIVFRNEFGYDDLLAMQTNELVKSAVGGVTVTSEPNPISNNSSGATALNVFVLGDAAGTATTTAAVGIFNDNTNVGKILSCLSGCPLNQLSFDYAKDTNSQIEDIFFYQSVKDAFAVLMNAEVITGQFVFDTNSQATFNRLMAVSILQGDYELIASIMPLAPTRTGPFIAAVVASWSAGNAFNTLKLFNGVDASSMVLDYSQTTNTVNFVNQVFPLLVAPQGVTMMAFIAAAADSENASTRQQEMMMIFNALLVELVGVNGNVKEVRLALTQNGYDRLIVNGGLSQFIIFEAIVETFIPIVNSINQVNKVDIFLAARDANGNFIPAIVDPTTGIISYAT